MRYSVFPNDPGYAAFKALPHKVRPIVYVDGELVTMVFTADDKRGCVVTADVDEAPGVAKLNARRDGVVKRQLFGKVRIELKRVR